MSELVERLRFLSSKYQDTCLEAIARIEALEAALREIASGTGNSFAPATTMMKIARAALDKDADND